MRDIQASYYLTDTILYIIRLFVGEGEGFFDLNTKQELTKVVSAISAGGDCVMWVEGGSALVSEDHFMKEVWLVILITKYNKKSPRGQMISF